MINKRKIQECIFNVDTICHDLNLAILDMIKLKVVVETPNLFNRELRLIYVQICSINDELKILNSISKNDEYLKETLLLIAPATRALNKYSGIRMARNSFIAHLNRDTNNNFKPFYKTLRNQKLPHTKEDLIPIITTIYLINQTLVTRYNEEWKEIRKTEEIEENIYKEWIKNLERNPDKNDPFKGVFDEVREKLKAKNITISTIGLPFKKF